MLAELIFIYYSQAAIKLSLAFCYLSSAQNKCSSKDYDVMICHFQNLASELQQVRLEKQALQSQFIELQHARESDLNQYQQELAALDEELRMTQEAQKESSVTMETNQELMLQLEKEKGRLAGNLELEVISTKFGVVKYMLNSVHKVTKVRQEMWALFRPFSAHYLQVAII